MAKKSLLKKPTQKTTKKVVTRPKATAKTDLIVEPEIQEERIVFDDLEGKMLHIKVGTDDNIAGVEHINDVRDDITRLINEHNVNCLVLVTHHAVNIDLIETRKD